MSNCLFCRIVSKETPATVVFESPKSLAFRDISPKAPTHVLVIPKEHVGSLMELSANQGELISDVHQTIQKVAQLEKVDHSGFRVVVNNGKDAGQAVSHLHYHVLAGRPMGWNPCS